MSTSSSGVSGSLISAGGESAKFVERHRLTILDAVLAQAIKNSNKQQGRTSLSDGTMNTYVRSSNNSYYSFRVKAPLSTDLLSPQAVTELSSLMPGSEFNGQPRALNISDEVIEHLDRPVQGAPLYEQKI